MNFLSIGVNGIPQNVRGTLSYERVINIVGAAIYGSCEIRAFSYINGGGISTSISNSSIGRYCSISGNVTINPGQHHTNLLSTHPVVSDPHDQSAGLSQFPEYDSVLNRRPLDVSPTKRMGNVKIGNDVWIGCNVIVLGGVTIGDGSIIGAGTIVANDVPAYSIFAGNPGRVIAKRFERTIIDELIALSWWDYDLSVIKHEVDYADVTGCIKIMTKAIGSGRMRKLSLPSYRLIHVGNEQYQYGEIGSFV